jgi:para-nitrobenzyl esterase
MCNKLLVLGIVVVALVGIAPARASLASPQADAAVVMTDKGRVRGSITDGNREFLGIPYAAPPIGELRWASPQPAKPWSGVRAATSPGNACAQLELPPWSPSSTEDCLYLNVTTPRHTGGRKLPVMVFIHGGGFAFGAGADTAPRGMAEQGDVIVVTINYRLGVLGFLTHPALDGGAALHRSGNFGLEDQQAALRWVRRNAAAFGGDSGDVTLFGQWSGGKAVCAQLVSPLATGLFQRAISLSNACTINFLLKGTGEPDPMPAGLVRPRGVGEELGLTLAKELGCEGPATAVAACLRAVATDRLLTQAASNRPNPFLFTPVFGGGGVLPVDPIEAYHTGQFAKVPFMVGVNRQGFRGSDAFLERLGFPPLTKERFFSRVLDFVGPDLESEVLQRYSLQDHENSPSLAWAALGQDAILSRPQVISAQLFARWVPTYTYEFHDENAPWYSGAPLPSFPPGSREGAELPYLFDTKYYAGQQLDPEQKRLSRQMITYLTRFARAGNPNGPGLPSWKPVSTDGRIAQEITPAANGIGPIDFASEHNFDFWQQAFRQLGLDQ